MTEQNYIMTEQLYVKKGRRYFSWGNTDSWDSGRDAMKIGTFRLIHCPEPGYFRYRHDVTPDTAAFLAAAGLAQHAMEEAMQKRAIATPSCRSGPYTPEQQAIIEKFRHDMAEAGALIPYYWIHGTAAEIAKAGVDAVCQFAAEQK